MLNDGGQTTGDISIHALVKRATKSVSEKKHSLKISIHALVKRATKEYAETLYSYVISIHALVKRATGIIKYKINGDDHFNPRPRKEGDPIFNAFRGVFFIFQSTPS